MEEGLQQEYQKGEISGIYLAGNLNELVLDAVEQEINEKRDEETEEEA